MSAPAVDLSPEEFAELKADAKFPGSRYPVNGLLRKVGQHPKGAEVLRMVAQVRALCDAFCDAFCGDFCGDSACMDVSYITWHASKSLGSRPLPLKFCEGRMPSVI